MTRKNQRSQWLVLPLLLAPLLASSARAEDPGHHPAYVHAIADLREAREELRRGGEDRQQTAAIQEIEEAIDELGQAARAVGRNPRGALKLEVERIDAEDSLDRALGFVTRARTRVQDREDDRDARDSQDRALKHIERAMRRIERSEDPERERD